MEPDQKTKKELRTFGLMMGTVLSVFTTVFFINEKFAVSWVLGSIAAGFILLGLAAPSALAGVHARWMKFADVIGRFNAKVILGFVFLVFFSLIRAIFFIIRKDPLKRSFDSSLDSYWEDHEILSDDPERYKNQF